jgi:hypothetical protein
MPAKDNLFRSMRPEDKVTRTNRAARDIIEAEDEARRSKTERLRAARVKLEAEAVPEPEPVKKPKAKRVKRIKV